MIQQKKGNYGKSIGNFPYHITISYIYDYDYIWFPIFFPYFSHFSRHGMILQVINFRILPWFLLLPTSPLSSGRHRVRSCNHLTSGCVAPQLGVGMKKPQGIEKMTIYSGKMMTYRGNRRHFRRLVGGWPSPLKNMKVNGKDYPIYYGK